MTTLLGVNAQVDLGNLAVGIGTFCLAAVTAYVALHQTQIEKRKTIASFRVAWMDKFRERVAQHTTISYEIVSLKKAESQDNADKASILSDLRDARRRKSESSALIRLMLKPDSTDDYEITLEKEVRKGESDTMDEHRERRKIIIENARHILSREWRRVRREVERENDSWSHRDD